MKTSALQLRETSHATPRAPRRIEGGAEFLSAALAAVVVEHVRLMVPATSQASMARLDATPDTGVRRAPLQLAKSSPLASTSVLEAALASLCAANAAGSAPHASNDGTAETAPPVRDPSAPRDPEAAPVGLPTAAEVRDATATDAHIALEHPALGAIRLSLSLEGTALVVHASTVSRSAATAVALCAPALRNALSAQGLSLRSLDVDVGDDAGDHEPRPRARKRRGLDTEA